MTDPASASTGRIDACLAIRAFACVRTVCRQSQSKLRRNEIGKAVTHPATAPQTSLTNTSIHLAHENAVQRRTCAAFRKHVVDQLPPIRVGPNAREHDFSGYGHSVRGANNMKKARNRHSFIPGAWGAYLYKSLFKSSI